MEIAGESLKWILWLGSKENIARDAARKERKIGIISGKSSLKI